MPVIEITIPQGSIAADRRQQLIANLSEALFKAEGLPELAACSVVFSNLPPRNSGRYVCH